MCVMCCINLNAHDLIQIYEFWCIPRGVAEDSAPRGYDIASGGNWILKFQRQYISSQCQDVITV
jgi:hypothetical protein